jgi:hypothetical protein
MNSLLKKPSAWIPIALSLAMLAYILSYIAIHGVPVPNPDADEGTGAHLFQIWLVLEVLMVLFFVIRWVLRAPKQAFLILAIQISAALLPISVVFSLKL